MSVPVQTAGEPGGLIPSCPPAGRAPPDRYPALWVSKKFRQIDVGGEFVVLVQPVAHGVELFRRGDDDDGVVRVVPLGSPRRAGGGKTQYEKQRREKNSSHAVFSLMRNVI